MHALAAILVSAPILAPNLPVDFRILTPSPAATPSATAPAPITRELLETPIAPPVAGGPRPANRGPARPAATHPVAQGFGNEVPLRFAARQLVPAGLEVVFAHDVDAESSVSWRGGVPWNRALQTAIGPLGLRMTHRGRTVTISR